MTPTVSAQPRQDLDDSRNDTTLYRGHRTGTRVPNNSGLTGSDYRNGNNNGALNKDTIPPPEPGKSGPQTVVAHTIILLLIFLPLRLQLSLLSTWFRLGLLMILSYYVAARLFRLASTRLELFPPS
ncbi:hypothetical protein D9611_006668 [Ephemerocybe angulata]|uniref:Uncharacterized protein n=1 Tax=Ephemerocybe angulata TaxID=980116 RepID=A0A8H5C9G1_9AGAR|nr:hypothetical protein D9611_006668 [Tulosesus angulatus]